MLTLLEAEPLHGPSYRAGMESVNVADRDARIEALQAEVERLRDVLGTREQVLLTVRRARDKAEDALDSAESRVRVLEGELRQYLADARALADELRAGDSERTVGEWLTDFEATLASVPDETTQPGLEGHTGTCPISTTNHAGPCPSGRIETTQPATTDEADLWRRRAASEAEVAER